MLSYLHADQRLSCQFGALLVFCTVRKLTIAVFIILLSIIWCKTYRKKCCIVSTEIHPNTFTHSYRHCALTVAFITMETSEHKTNEAHLTGSGLLWVAFPLQHIHKLFYHKIKLIQEHTDSQWQMDTSGQYTESRKTGRARANR